MISVCLTTYNGEHYIRQQVESILSQLSPDDELIVSDDGSTDNTLSIIQSLNASQVKIIVNSGQHGYTPNFENAIEHCKGDYIFLSDQDDIWQKNKVKVCMDYFLNYDFIISDAIIIDKNNKKIASSYFAQRHSRSGLINNLIRFSYLGCCMAFKRKVLERALPFPKNHKKATHDNWLAVVGMSYYKTKIIDEKLILYRRHGNNTSKAGLAKTTTLAFKAKYRLYLLVCLLSRCRHKALPNKTEDKKT